MSTDNIYSVLQTKLAAQYDTVANSWPELWRAYWADADGGNNGGVPKTGDALISHLGGGNVDFATRLAAWTAALEWP